LPEKRENILIFIAHHEKESDELEKLLSHLEVLKSENALTNYHVLKKLWMKCLPILKIKKMICLRIFYILGHYKKL